MTLFGPPTYLHEDPIQSLLDHTARLLHGEQERK